MILLLTLGVENDTKDGRKVLYIAIMLYVFVNTLYISYMLVNQ
jgi:hypothetical protein